MTENKIENEEKDEIFIVTAARHTRVTCMETSPQKNVAATALLMITNQQGKVNEFTTSMIKN